MTTKTKCQAIIHVFDKSYNLSRSCTTTKSQTCSRNGKEQVKHLCLCTTHANLAREGMMYESGEMMTSSMIADIRKYAKLESAKQKWAKEE